MPPQTLYHGTFRDEVGKILAGIQLRDGQAASDFNATDRPRAFYLTPDLGSAKQWAAARQAWAGNTAPLAVMEYTLDAANLRVYDFGDAKTGAEFQKWQRFIANNYGGKPTLNEFKDFDVIKGFMSAGGDPTKPETYAIWDWDDSTLMRQVALLTSGAVGKLTFVKTINI